MSKPVQPPIVTIDLSPVYAAIEEIQQSVDTANLALLSVMERVTKLEAPVIVVPPVVLPPSTDSPAFLAAVEKHRSNIETYGRPIAALLADPNVPALTKQDAVYYDGCWVFLQIADYTGDLSWHVAARNAHEAYRGYLDFNQNKPAGYDLFPHGLYIMNDYDTLKALAVNAAFANAPIDWTASADVSRECAYNVMTKLIAVDLGQAVVNLEEQAQQMFGHVAQWTQILNGQPVTGIPTGQSIPTYCRPFMAALTSYGMIEWAGADVGRLKAVTDTLTPFWSLLWSKCFLPQAAIPNLGNLDTMMYTNSVAADGTGGMDPSPDLNLLIAPVLAWLYAQTKDVTWRDKHDRLFIGGVAGAYLGNGKQFNQSYQRSFQGLMDRNS